MESPLKNAQKCFSFPNFSHFILANKQRKVAQKRGRFLMELKTKVRSFHEFVRAHLRGATCQTEMQDVTSQEE